MSTGYKLMLLFFVLAYLAGIFFLPGVSWVKYLGAIPLLTGLYLSLSDPENFDPEAGRFWGAFILMLIAILWPLTLYVMHKNLLLQ